MPSFSKFNFPLSSLNSTASKVLFDGTGTKLASSNVEDAIKELALKDFYQTNRLNLSSNKQLVNSDKNMQLIKNESAGTINVNLPLSPKLDMYFLIASRSDSLGPINVNGITLNSNERVEWIYDGVEWFPL